MLEILQAILVRIVRSMLTPLLMLLFAYLGHHAWITPDEQNHITLWFNGWTSAAVSAGFAIVIPVLWSMREKFVSWARTRVALMLPANSTRADVLAIAAQLPEAALYKAPAAPLTTPAPGA
jgi:hypothetical protein